MTQDKNSPALRPEPGGKLSPILKIKQVYYCAGATCLQRRKRVESWLTVADGARLLEGGGVRCRHCGERLKWVRSEQVCARHDPES